MSQHRLLVYTFRCLLLLFRLHLFRERPENLKRVFTLRQRCVWATGVHKSAHRARCILPMRACVCMCARMCVLQSCNVLMCQVAAVYQRTPVLIRAFSPIHSWCGRSISLFLSLLSVRKQRWGLNLSGRLLALSFAQPHQIAHNHPIDIPYPASFNYLACYELWAKL